MSDNKFEYRVALRELETTFTELYDWCNAQFGSNNWRLAPRSERLTFVFKNRVDELFFRTHFKC